MHKRLPKYHMFFTANHVQSCIENGRFGATSINSLVDVIKNDKAFIYDGKESKLYGPFLIESNEQFHEVTPIYGLNKKDLPRYTNRIAFSSHEATMVEYKDLYAVEADYHDSKYLLNRTLLSTMIENKQVHSMPLTNVEGEYLDHIFREYGKTIECNSSTKDFINELTISEKLKLLKPTEAFFETSLMLNKPFPILDINSLSNPLIFNQFVIGIQRQTDILSISEREIKIYELKKKDNITDPFLQLLEYSIYIKRDYRMKEFNVQEKSIHLIAMLEKGNKYLYEHDKIDQFKSEASNLSIHASVFEMSIEKDKDQNILSIIERN